MGFSIILGLGLGFPLAYALNSFFAYKYNDCGKHKGNFKHFAEKRIKYTSKKSELGIIFEESRDLGEDSNPWDGYRFH